MARLAVVLLAALALSACGGNGEEAGNETATAAEAAVSLGGETLDGGSLSLDEFRGKPVFVNVWASW